MLNQTRLCSEELTAVKKIQEGIDLRRTESELQELDSIKILEGKLECAQSKIQQSQQRVKELETEKKNLSQSLVDATEKLKGKLETFFFDPTTTFPELIVCSIIVQSLKITLPLSPIPLLPSPHSRYQQTVESRISNPTKSKLNPSSQSSKLKSNCRNHEDLVSMRLRSERSLERHVSRRFNFVSAFFSLERVLALIKLT